MLLIFFNFFPWHTAKSILEKKISSRWKHCARGYAWQENCFYDQLKHFMLITCRWISKLCESAIQRLERKLTMSIQLGKKLYVYNKFRISSGLKLKFVARNLNYRYCYSTMFAKRDTRPISFRWLFSWLIFNNLQCYYINIH